jgi:hypothetical protein
MVDYRETDGAEDPEAPELYRVAAAHVALGMDQEDAEAVRQHLVDAGVFPVTRQANGLLMVENDLQEEDLALHAERVDTVSLDSQRGLATGPINSALVEQASGPVPAGVHDLLAARFQQERTARRAAEEELESARRLIGQGPFAIVKLNSLNALTDHGMAEIKVGFGGGVTKHMLAAVLSLGQQAVAEEAGRHAAGEQEATVRLPDARNLGHGHVRPRADGAKARCGGPGICPECSRERAAEKPQE